MTPKGFTWHHCEDGKTLILVPRDIHYLFKHTGGESIIKQKLIGKITGNFSNLP